MLTNNHSEREAALRNLFRRNQVKPGKAGVPETRNPRFTSPAARTSAVSTLRTIVPTLIIPLGTTACSATSWTKEYLQDQGTDSYTRVVAIDTDEHAQAGAEGCSPFTDEEFVRVKTARVRNVIQNPKCHKRIVERAGLDEDDAATFHERLLNEGIEQAGQVRSFGHLALLSDYSETRNALRRAISELNGAYSDLEKQLESPNRVIIKRKMRIYVIFSGAGGTGSSMALETMAILRELTVALSVEIIGVMIMPSAFDGVMEGRREQETRIRANAYACMQELNAFRQGFGTQYGVKLGPDEHHELPVPAGLFNQLFAVGRHMADGRDLRTPEAVVHTIALNLAAEIGTEIADRIEADDANEATLRGLTPDPMTGKPRYLSSFGATALTLPRERISRLAAAQHMHDFIRDCVLGTKPASEVVGQSVDAWTALPLAGEPLELKPSALPQLLRRHVLPNAAILIRGLFEVVSGTQRVHFKDSKFPRHVQRVKQAFQEVQLPDFEARLTAYSNELIAELLLALKLQIESLARSKGYCMVDDFCRGIARSAEVAIETLQKQASENFEHGKAAFAKSQEALVPLLSFWGSFGTDHKRQDLVADRLQEAMSLALDGVAKNAALRIFQALHGAATQHQSEAETVIADCEGRLRQMRVASKDCRAGRKITTNSEAEIDVSTPHTDQKLIRKHCINNAAILDLLTEKLETSPALALMLLATDGNVFESLVCTLQDRFKGALETTSVVDVLAEQLADEYTRDDALARMRQAVVGCQPLWRAESRQNGVEFADAMVLGVPRSDNSTNREAVTEALMKAATHRIRPNNQYHGTATLVCSGDANRIYVIRRTHGACLHYLPEVIECEAAYQQWNRSGGHHVHIFNKGIVAKMPALLPNSDVDDGELAFAIGVAYGWIANRGTYWYWNLTPDTTNGNRVCRLKSHWNGVAFQSQARTSGGALDTFVETGRLSYTERDDFKAVDKLDQGMDKALQALCTNGEMIELIIDTWEELRAAAGDVKVADQLEPYVESLKRRTRSSDQNYDLTTRMASILGQKVNDLRRG